MRLYIFPVLIDIILIIKHHCDIGCPHKLLKITKVKVLVFNPRSKLFLTFNFLRGKY